jgi:hypothetical protein
MGAGTQGLQHSGIVGQVPSPMEDSEYGSSPSIIDADTYRRNYLAELTQLIDGDLSNEEEEQCMLHARQTLDPDLASHRSFSASALVHIQRERNRQRKRASNKAWMSKRIVKLKKELGLA